MTTTLPQIQIDMDSLTIALEGHGDMTSNYLDKKTGKVVFISEDDIIAEDEEIKKLIEAEPDRFLWIEPVSSSQGFRFMEEFVETLPDGEAKMILCKALSWKKPFSNFRDALCDYPDISKQWFEYHDKVLGEWAADWLKGEGIDADLAAGNKEK